jgi:SNF2 family DNA or RNA helicase
MFFRVVEVSSCPVCKAVIQKGNCIIHPTMKNSRNKIEVIVEALGRVEKSEKVIIFTQFHNLVQRIAREFEKVGMPYLELKGVPSEINYRLNIFRNDPSLRILLLSIEQAASGINLT